MSLLTGETFWTLIHADGRGFFERVSINLCVFICILILRLKLSLTGS